MFVEIFVEHIHGAIGLKYWNFFYSATRQFPFVKIYTILKIAIIVTVKTLREIQLLMQIGISSLHFENY